MLWSLQKAFRTETVELEEDMDELKSGMCTQTIIDFIQQSCIFSLCLFNLYIEYIMQNAQLDELQYGIKITGEDTNNLT